MNYMSEVAKMLGVELGEKFKIHGNEFDSNYTYYLTNNGIVIDKDGYACASNDVLCDLIRGKYTIKRKPWKPNDNDDFWYVDVDGYVYRYCCFNIEDADYVNYYKLGNCYRTPEEAEANSAKWLAFYESDEVLDVKTQA